MPSWQRNLMRWADKIKDFQRRLADPTAASFDTGRVMVARGEYREALRRFARVTDKQPNNAAAWYNTACCLFALMENADGIAALKHSLTLDPHNNAGKFLLAGIDDGAHAEGFHPTTTPRDMIISRYGALAAQYDTAELTDAAYVGHLEMARALETIIPQGMQADRLLDAGCGTGLCGAPARPFARELVGVDLVAPMLDQARVRGVYDHLKLLDVRDHLARATDPVYDVIIAANLLPVMGDVAPLLQGAVKALQPGGYVLLSAYAYPQTDRFGLLPGRLLFGHGEEYLRAQAARAGLLIHRVETAPLYGVEPAVLAIFQKAAR